MTLVATLAMGGVAFGGENEVRAEPKDIDVGVTTKTKGLMPRNKLGNLGKNA